MIAVSVVIPTHNRAGKVTRAVSSVLAQTFTDYEIIVVDDGSTDETEKALSQFSSRVTLISHHANLGVSAARNSGICASKSRFVAFLDSDDYWLPEKLETQMGFFVQNPDAVICQTEEIWMRRGKRVNPRKIHMKPSGYIFEASLKLCLVSPSSVMLKRSTLDEVGLFDQTLPACEDYDLWLRISCYYPIFLIKQHLVVKEGGEPDQLSARFMGMDRFRIRSMTNLLKSFRLTKSQEACTFEELRKKCQIYGRGCLKNGKEREGAYYLGLPDILKEELIHHRTESASSKNGAPGCDSKPW